MLPSLPWHALLRHKATPEAGDDHSRLATQKAKRPNGAAFIAPVGVGLTPMRAARPGHSAWSRRRPRLIQTSISGVQASPVQVAFVKSLVRHVYCIGDWYVNGKPPGPHQPG